MQQLVASLEEENESGLRALHRHLHSLAGLGATLGFPGVSSSALEGERLLEPVISATRAIDPHLIERLGELVVGMQSAFGVEPIPLAPDLLAPAPRVRGRDPDILVVAADPEIRALLDSVLDRERLPFRFARDVASALVLIEERTPDAILTDTRLPDGNGYQVIESLRARPDGDHTAAIVTSGASGFLDKVEAMRCGADAFFEQPIDTEALGRRLRQLTAIDQPAPRVLLVDDDEQIHELMALLLEGAGYEFRACSEPRELENTLGEFCPDLLLMDVHLPGVSGYDLARWVRQSEKWLTLPLIVVTTDTPMASRIASLRAGADDHIEKPVSPPLLLTAIAARIERSRLLRTLVERDGLTGLLTHSAFMERIKARYAQSRRSALISSALAMIDLDHFKQVNDRYGHPTGDRVLVALATLLRRRLRSSDTIGRYGGEEFAVLIEDLNGKEASRLIERLLDEFRETTLEDASGETFSVTFSGGIAMLETKTPSFEEWLDDADRALYKAKESGRNRIEMG